MVLCLFFIWSLFHPYYVHVQYITKKSKLSLEYKTWIQKSPVSGLVIKYWKHFSSKIHEIMWYFVFLSGYYRLLNFSEIGVATIQNNKRHVLCFFCKICDSLRNWVEFCWIFSSHVGSVISLTILSASLINNRLALDVVKY